MAGRGDEALAFSRAREGREGEAPARGRPTSGSPRTPSSQTLEELQADIAERLAPDAADRGAVRLAGEQRRRARRAGRRRRGARGAGRRGAAPRGSTTSGIAWSSRGSPIDQFLAATGRDAESLLAELRVDALRSVKADLALRALAEAEDLEVDDAELDEQPCRERRAPEGRRRRAARPARPQWAYGRGTLGAEEGQGAYMAARPRAARRRGGESDVSRRVCE